MRALVSLLAPKGKIKRAASVGRQLPIPPGFGVRAVVRQTWKEPPMKRTPWPLLLVVAAVDGGCAHPSEVFVQTDKEFRSHRLKEAPVILWEAGDVAAAKPFRTVGVVEIRRIEADSLVMAQRDTYEMRTQQLPPYAANYLGNPSGTWRVNGFAAWQFYCGLWGTEAVDPGEARYTRRVATKAALALRSEGRGEVICTHTAAGGSRVRRDMCMDAQGLSEDSPK
jgi:hypothetical protein